MLLDLAQLIVREAERLQTRDIVVASFVAVPILLLLLWRLWTFTIFPSLRPREPRTIPYWIPMLGNALAFFHDFGSVLEHGKSMFGHTNEIYRVILGGQRLYVMTSPRDISKAYKNTEALTFDNFMVSTIVRLGASRDAVQKWFPLRKQVEGVLGLHGRSEKPAHPLHHEQCHLGENLCRQQLLPGEDLEVLQKVLMKDIQDLLHWEGIADHAVLSSSQDTKTVSLIRWSRDVLLQAATRAFFGDRLIEIDPTMFESFYTFDEQSWKLNYQFPKCLSRDMYAAKDRVIDALEIYFSLPFEERPGQSWLIGSLETEMRKLGIATRDIAAIVMPMYWVVNANAWKSCFWTLSYLLFDPTLLEAVRREIEPICAEGMHNLEMRLEERCPLLDAVYCESLRLTSSSSTVRHVRQTVDLGTKTLRAGANVLIPYRQLHRNEQVFGQDAESFRPERFLQNKELRRSPYYRPFGGGLTHCTGRFLAKREILTFLAVVLYRFDVSLASDRQASPVELHRPVQKFPRLDTKKLSLALFDRVIGDDVVVDVKRRKV